MNAETQEYEQRDRVVVQPIGICYDPENIPQRFLNIQKEVVERVVFHPYFIVYEGYRIPITIKSISSGAARKGGGFGTCYVIEIRGREFRLYHVHPYWFLEGRLAMIDGKMRLVE